MIKNFKMYNESKDNDLLIVPEEFETYRSWMGDTVTADVVIDDYNKVMDGGEFELIGYSNGMFIGYDMSNDEEIKVKSNDIFLELNDYYNEQ